MNSIFSKLLPGLIPIIIFFIADEIFGTKIGVLIALAFGVVQLFYIRLRQKRWDRFVIFDTILLVLLGIVSYFLESDKLIYWKFVLIDLLLIGFILFSLYSRKNLFLMMSKRYMGEIEIAEEQKKFMNVNLKAFLIISIIHAVITSYSILNLSSAATLFIGGTLLYIMLGVWILFVFLRNIISRRKISGEFIPIINEDGKILEKISRDEVHNGSMKLDPVVHLHVIREDGAFLLQLRPKSKEIQPNKWDTSVGGHVAWGESMDKALFRESKEEIGLKNFKPIFVEKYIWESEVEREMVFLFVYRASFEEKFYPSSEVADLRWWTQSEIRRNLRKGVFTPNFEHEFLLLTTQK